MKGVKFNRLLGGQKKGIAEEQVFFKTLLESSPELVIVLQSDGTITYHNMSDKALFGYEYSELIGKKIFDYVDEDERSKFIEKFNACQKASENFLMSKIHFRHRDGSRILFKLNGNNFVEHPSVKGVVLNLRHIKSKIGHNEPLSYDDNSKRLFYQDNQSIMLIISPDTGKIIDANGAALKHYGYSIDELVLKNVSDLVTPTDTQVLSELKRAKAGEHHFYCKHYLKGGRQRDVEVYCGPLKNKSKVMIYFIIHDITERRKIEQRLGHQMNQDLLTGLPNQKLFEDRLNTSIALSQRNKNKLAVLMIDLDDIKKINSRLGHAIGDLLLKEFADRLKMLLRESDSLARIGGDEFAILLPDVTNIEAVSIVAEKIMATVHKPWVYSEKSIELTISLGIACYPDDGNDTKTLVSQARTALYLAKNIGKNNYQYINLPKD